MNANQKTNERLGRRLLNGLMQDWVWEVCLILVATPLVWVTGRALKMVNRALKH